MLTHEHLFIGGSWVRPSGDEYIEVVSPATEQVIGQVPEALVADVDRAVTAARSAFDTGPWPHLAPAERASALSRLSAAVKARSDSFADVISSEVGSARKWSPFGQVAIATAVFDAYIDFADNYPWVERRPGSFGATLRINRLPVGVVAAIVPWNAPLFVTALKLAPALLAGATVVLKPAPETPLDAYLLAEAAVEAGLPDGVLSIVPARAAASEHLASHPDVDKVSFTGSTSVGRRIGEICGHDIRRCTLELGGKSAALLLDDVELSSRTVDALVMGAMANNGQVCAAQTRLLAPRSRYAEVVDALADATQRLAVGDPFDQSTDIGPVVSEKQRDRVEHYLAAGLAEGATLVAGGGRPAGLDRGWFVSPTVFSDVTPGMTIAREEIFGPVLAVLPYDDEAEAVSLANDSTYGLAGTVWTADPEHGESIASRIRTGVVAINSGAPLDLQGPFGGFKQSGIGRESGPEGITPYIEYQTVVLPRVRSGRPTAPAP